MPINPVHFAHALAQVRGLAVPADALARALERARRPVPSWRSWLLRGEAALN